ncbi:hypothetical protein BDD12DRAFT_854214, partial [Trichophaea hybrida]
MQKEKSYSERKQQFRNRKEGNDERTCYQCGLPGHFKANCTHYKRVQEQRTTVTKANG